MRRQRSGSGELARNRQSPALNLTERSLAQIAKTLLRLPDTGGESFAGLEAEIFVEADGVGIGGGDGEGESAIAVFLQG